MVTHDQIRWYRLKRSGLVEPFQTVEDCASALGGIQAQFLYAAGLALWNRTNNFDHAHFEQLLYRKRTLVKLGGHRGALHIYPSKEWPLIHSAGVNLPTWRMKQLEKLGIAVRTYREMIEHLAEYVEHLGLFTRDEILNSNLNLDLVPEGWLVSSWGGVVADLVHDGYVYHAEPPGGKVRSAHRKNWLPELVWDVVGFDEANIELARRYFHAYGPTTMRDFAYWRGVKIPYARKWFDPLLMAHKDKSWLIDMQYYKRVWMAAGHVQGTIVIQGRIGGTSRYDKNGKELRVAVPPFQKLARPLRGEIEHRAEQMAGYFGLPSAECRFSMKG